jgi:uncharacterized cysteine cluster protein YcgN (CxxCxxCC family)
MWQNLELVKIKSNTLNYACVQKEVFKNVAKMCSKFTHHEIGIWGGQRIACIVVHRDNIQHILNWLGRNCAFANNLKNSVLYSTP